MRLLKLEDEDQLTLVEYIGDNIPKYAILSHTWGPDSEEVSFQDLKNDTCRHKIGYNKIRFCGQQAAKDNLQYFWVDSCCIDKSSSTELSEAINSMFYWYQKAEKCYVYLPDVLYNSSHEDSNSADEDSELSRRQELSLRKSRWFTRGWTLQELIAPEFVEFFSEEGKRLGDKRSLERMLHEITAIPIKALQGSALSEFSVDERFSWADKRNTTREEDGAYCLLGIFDIQMPLLYGERRQKAMKRLRKEVNEAGMDMSDEKASKIRRWLSAPDPSANYLKALKQRQDETGRWFLRCDSYAKWDANVDVDAVHFIWLYGIPGCGKTILSSTILHDVLQYCDNDPDKVVLYFYFDFNDVQKQNPQLMLYSLVRQLLQQSAKIPTSLNTLFLKCDNGSQQPSVDVLMDVMQQMMQEFAHVYVVLDALDECSEREELMGVLETMAEWQLKHLHVLVTSRKERDIESSLETFIDGQDCICLQSELVDRDIQIYVQQRLENDKRLSKWRKDVALRQEIETVLMKGARGMFRWAVCQLDILGECRTRATLRRSLATLPPTLDKTYDRILSAISETDSHYAVTILQWLTFSARPLSLDEVAEIVAIDVEDKPKFDPEDVLEDPMDVLDIFSSLVTVTTNSVTWELESGAPIVALAHYSVKEYLLSDRIRKGSAARYGMQESICHGSIAKGCLGYLLQFEREVLTEYNFKDFKLAVYSGNYWYKHVQGTEEQTEVLNQAVTDLLLERDDVYTNWLRIHDPDSPWAGFGLRESMGSVPPPLYYASLIGIEKAVERLLDRGADVNAQGGRYNNALQAASSEGHERQVVKLLLNTGADVNAQDGSYGNALQAALSEGHDQVVKLLLEKGA
ncbi:HET-domain-containing protein, partial [Pleomassaria siparia CBS 279.74]